ncbi:putative uncharacterized protein C8orf44 [Plecturocebus cupreus]
MPVIPALWEAQAGGSLEVRSLRLAWPTWQNPISTKNTKIRRAWWHMPVIPATRLTKSIYQPKTLCQKAQDNVTIIGGSGCQCRDSEPLNAFINLTFGKLKREQQTAAGWENTTFTGTGGLFLSLHWGPGQGRPQEYTSKLHLELHCASLPMLFSPDPISSSILH